MQRAGKVMMQKRGMSPLIATVLLIAFAVALGAVVMNLGRTYYPGEGIEPGPISCGEGVTLSVHSVDNSLQILSAGTGDQGYLEFTIDNTGVDRVEALALQVDGAGGSEGKIYRPENIPDSSIEPAYSLTKRINYDFTRYGEIRQVTFIPYVIYQEAVKPCLVRKLTVTGIPQQ